PPLREAIASYLGAVRAVRCSPEQVIVVGGSQQALDLAARVLLDPGNTVWFEEPGYLGARAALRGAGAQVIPVPVDEDGLDVGAGEAMASAARMAYVTPSHQYPLGVTMSLSRRLALLAWATRADAWILEDDYDSEFRYAGRPLAALQGLDTSARVIYIGTFSKTLLPSLRLGYLVVPPDLVDAFTSARAVVDRQSPLLDQAVLCDFITEGHFSRHIRRMRQLYAERQRLLLEAAGRELAGLIDLGPESAGLHLVGRLPAGVNDQAASRAAYGRGVDAVALSATYFGPTSASGLLLGYAAYSGKEIMTGARELARALDADGEN
ncbi:MAG: PLP-dependent aminotransferase family protein, partial [Chloroflexi bacterium]|nr:PLP-dependent aminotransferase family protein [Chloroflexota bacterium]